MTNQSLRQKITFTKHALSFALLGTVIAGVFSGLIGEDFRTLGAMAGILLYVLEKTYAWWNNKQCSKD